MIEEANGFTVDRHGDTAPDNSAQNASVAAVAAQDAPQAAHVPADPNAGKYITISPGMSVDDVAAAHYGASIDAATADKRPDDDVLKNATMPEHAGKLRAYADARLAAVTEHADRLFNVNVLRGLLRSRHMTITGQQVFVPDTLPEAEKK